MLRGRARRGAREEGVSEERSQAKQTNSRQKDIESDKQSQMRDQIRLITNSHKSQSEKLATGRGRESTVEKPDNNEVPGPHH